MRTRKYKKIVFKIVVSILLSVITASYFEEKFVSFYMPLRYAYVQFTSDRVLENKKYNKFGIELKKSKHGDYVNPWQAASSVLKIAKKVNKSGCDHISKKDTRKLSNVANYFSQSALTKIHNRITFSVWEYPIEFSYGLKPGWVSAPAQAEIALVLYSASKCSKDMSLNALAKNAVSSFLIPVESGGVLAELGGDVWYEEYAQPGIRPPLVLNGHVYSLVALYELMDFDTRAYELFNKGSVSALKNMSKYDAIVWTMYDQFGRPANNIYQQKLHIRLMGTMYDLTREQEYLGWYKKFHMQSLFPFSAALRMLMKPSRFLAFIISANAILIFIFLVALSSIKRLVLFQENASK